jgi:hypothetical protein
MTANSALQRSGTLRGRGPQSLLRGLAPRVRMLIRWLAAAGRCSQAASHDRSRVLMKRRLCGTGLLLCLIQMSPAQVGSTRIEFECGGATVVIDSQPKGFKSPEAAFVETGMVVEAHIVVSRGEGEAKFQSWNDIDYIGGTCMEDARGQPRIVYRAFCGGSGCSDQSWGVIDPAALRELLVPSASNTEQAREILGVQPKDGPRLLGLLSAE